MSNEQQQCRQIVLPDVPGEVTHGIGPIWLAISRWYSATKPGTLAAAEAQRIDSAIISAMRDYATEAVRQDRASRPVEAVEPPLGRAKPVPWYPDDSGQWVEVTAGPAATPADVGLSDGDQIEVLVETERRYRSYQKRVVAAAAEWFHGDSDFSDFTGSRIVAYKLVEKAKQAPDADGWIEWKGGACPVAPETPVQIKIRSSITTAGHLEAREYRWSHIGSDGDIVAYRVLGEYRAPDATPGGPVIGQTWWVSVKGSDELTKALIISISDQTVAMKITNAFLADEVTAYRRSAVEFVEVCNG